MKVEKIAEYCQRIASEVGKAVIGKQEILLKMMAAFLSSGGHILLEDYPGMAKTLIANSFSVALGLDFKRIQFTPDLLPGDITGGYIFNNRENQFVLRKGPLFTNILLADEINRASPKTQSALLEAMQENRVSLEGESHLLPDPFIVMATQNPIEYEGTFPLPEAQLDRFLIRLSVGYPTMAEEKEILTRRSQRKLDNVSIESIINPEIFHSMRLGVEEVFIDPDLQHYIVQLISKTRQHKQVELGVSPRGSLALLKLSRSWAAINGRDFVLPDDIKTFAQPALSHRIILDPNLWGTKKADTSIIEEILRSTPVPVASTHND
ncbi:MAG: magnesium chelatase [Chloroflexi bacterium HGW-Chloroflexi-4]|nr:MAG: magnesium chelatase [Chloroflexi bacterium HGW-Chloroflexi-4]